MEGGQRSLGSVVSLWRYPIKSMMGEEMNAADVTERGLLGDRAYALLDPSTGKVVSAKNPQKWGTLFDFRSSFVRVPRMGEPLPAVRITLPDGTMTHSSDGNVRSVLSESLGRSVELVSAAPDEPSLEEYWPDIEGLALREKVTDEAMPANTFFDLGVLHILTTATLDRLRELYPEGRFEVRRYRPNIVVGTPSDETGFVENDWVGRTFSIGDEVRLKVTEPCPRCVMTTLPQGDLPRDPGILRTAAKHNKVHVGVYASVSREGVVRRGDPVRAV
ncbi:MAG: MOSC domain-containing protein [Thermoplasmata archaeon]